MAPKRFAASSLPSSMSSATITPPPAWAAPWMLFSPTPPQADHRDGVAFGHPCRVGHGAEAGDDPAGQKRGDRERQVARDLHHLAGVNQGLFGKGAACAAPGRPRCHPGPSAGLRDRGERPSWQVMPCPRRQ